VQHTTTTYAAGSGVQPGASSAAGDTVIGPAGAHQLVINDTSGTGAFGTVSLNGGPAVIYTNANTDLAVIGADGEVVHVDTTAISAGFAGSVAITANGTLSIDGGTTVTAIDFIANQGIVDGGDGSIAYIDSQNVRRTGEDAVEFADTLDVFATLARLRDELRNAEGRSPQENSAALGRRLSDFDRLSDHLLGVIGDQGVTLQQFDQMQARAEVRELLAEQTLAETEGTDYATAALQLQQQQAAIQFSLASIVRVFDSSILNYL
jgi:flagellin-like hook-associated protein FlgL